MKITAVQAIQVSGRERWPESWRCEPVEEGRLLFFCWEAACHSGSGADSGFSKSQSTMSGDGMSGFEQKEGIYSVLPILEAIKAIGNSMIF